jgi:zinc protease
MSRRALAGLGLLALVGCGGTQDAAIRLPSDGAGHAAPPPAPLADAWTGRTLLAPPAAIEPRPRALPPIAHFALPNGLDVLLVREPGAAMTSVQLAIKAGRRDEAAEQLGVASVAAAALIRGSAARGRAALDAAAEAAGISLSASASFEVTHLGCRATKARHEACVAMLGELISRPGLAEAQIADAKAEVAASLRQTLGDPGQLAGLHLARALWGADHVRGWIASEAAIARLGRADVVRWHRERLAPAAAVLLVSGDLPRAPLEASLRRAFGGWRGTASTSTAAPAADPAPRGVRIALVDLPGAVHAQVRIGQLGVAHGDADFAATTVVDHILGGGTASRLATAARAKLGPASAASSNFDRNAQRGAWVAAGSAPSAQAVDLLRAMLAELDRLATQGPSAAEVARAISELAGAYQVRLDAPSERANALLAARLHGLDDASVRDFPLALGAVDLAAAREAATRRLSGKDVVVVFQGDGKMIGKALAKAGLPYQPVALDPSGGAAPAAPEEPIAEAGPAEVAKARAVVDAAIARKGGAARLRALQTIRWTGRATIAIGVAKMAGRVEKRIARPDRMRLDLHFDAGPNVVSDEVSTVVSGARGWSVKSGGGRAPGVYDFPPEAAATARAMIWRDVDLVLLRALERGARLTPEADVDLDGQACAAIRVRGKDAERGVLLLIERATKRVVGLRYREDGQAVEERYGDFRAVRGIEIPHRRRFKSPEVDMDATLAEVKVDEPIDAAVFAHPPAP